MFLVVMGLLVLVSPLYFMILLTSSLAVETKMIASAAALGVLFVLPLIYIIVSRALAL